MSKIYPFNYAEWSLIKNGKAIKPMNENLWFREHQSLLLAVANHPEGRDLLCIDPNLPPVIEIAKNHVTCFLDTDGRGRVFRLADFRVGAKWANIIRYRWPDFVKMAKDFYSHKEFGLHRLDISGLLAASTSTTFPDADPETTSVDGWAEHAGTDWDTAHDGVGNGSNAPGTSINMDCYGLVSSVSKIGRGIMLFDTSGMGAGGIIDAATISLYDRDNLVFTDNDAEAYFSIVQTNNINTDTNIINSDFTDVGDAIDNPTEGIDVGDRVRMEDSATSAYVDFPLNATGRGWVDPASITYLGVREGHDIEDVPIADTLRNFKSWWAADNLSNEPKLVVTYHHEDIVPIPKVNFNFTPKVLIVSVSAVTLINIPSATFNFTRFPLTVHNTNVGIPIPKADFNFVPKVLTVDLTGNNVIGIPSKSFNFSTKVLSVLVSNSEEEIQWFIADLDGEPITGAAPTLKIRARSTGYLLDWSDLTFKLGGGSSPTTTMPELDAADFPGYYAKIINLSTWSDDFYTAALEYDAVVPQQNSAIEFLVQSGKLAADQNTAKLDVSVSSRANATDQATILSNVADILIDSNLLVALMQNKREIKKIGAAWYLIIYDAAGGPAEILNKQLLDKDGNNITDIEAGIMTVELASSV